MVKEAAVQARPSPGVEQFFGIIRGKHGLSLVDFASVSQSSVSLVTGLGHKIYFEDFFEELDAIFGDGDFYANQAEADAKDRFLRSALNHGDGAVDRRTSARVVLLDDDGAVLLFCGSDPAITDGTAPRWWFTVGGQAHPGERLVDTAVREIAEETGLTVHRDQMVGPVWRRDSVIDFNGTVIQSQEFYFVHRTSRFEPTTGGRTDLELRYIHGHRWCDSATIEKLAADGETVYPLQLGELLAEANQVADDRGSRPPGELQPIR